MTIKLNGKSLTIDKVVQVARDLEPVEVAADAWERIKKCRAMLDDKVAKREVMYGVTTGIGELSEVVLTPEQTHDFQRYLVYSHSAGCGEPCDQDDVPRGYDRPRQRPLPRVFGAPPGRRRNLRPYAQQGRHAGRLPAWLGGACGDLSPMSQIALVLIGEGEAYYQGKRLSGKDALAAAGISPIVFEARDGLAAINGSNLITGMGASSCTTADRGSRLRSGRRHGVPSPKRQYPMPRRAASPRTRLPGRDGRAPRICAA